MPMFSSAYRIPALDFLNKGYDLNVGVGLPSANKDRFSPKDLCRARKSSSARLRGFRNLTSGQIALDNPLESPTRRLSLYLNHGVHPSSVVNDGLRSPALDQLFPTSLGMSFRH